MRRASVPKPVKRPDSDYWQFDKRLPRALKPRLVGMKLTIPFGGHTYAATIKPSTSDIRFSLRTTSYQEAVARNLEAHHYVASCLEAARSDADVVLSYKQIFALAGEFYRLSVSDLDFLKGNLISWNSERGGVPGLSAGIPDDPEIYKAETFFMEVAAATAERFSQAETSGIQCDAGLRAAARLLLAKHCVPRISPESASLLVDELKRRLPEALERTARLAAGDYSPDPKLASFPAFETAPSTRATHSLSLEGLFEEWWAHAQRLGMSMATHESYSHTIRKLKAHLKTDDALSITEGDLTGFRDACLQSVTLGTATRHIVVLKSIFGWAAEHDKMPSNPASGVVLKKPRRVKLRERDFTDEEARAILTAADRLGSLPSPKLNDLMRRWVPWLCAYTGCRVGELVQLRKEDIREAEDGEWVLTITPAAGPVKSKEAREIPLHAHLVEKGFLTFWRSKPKGPLFMEATKPEAFRAAWQGKKLALAKFARSVVTDPNVSPNHAWRHTFKSKGFEAGIQEKVLDAICGHAPATVGRAYGSVTLKTKIDAMKLFPRYGGRGKA